MFVSFLHAKNPKHHLKNWSAIEKYVKQLIYTHKTHPPHKTLWHIALGVPMRPSVQLHTLDAMVHLAQPQGMRDAGSHALAWDGCTLAHLPPLLLSSSALHGRKTSKKSPLLNMKSTLELVFTSFTCPYKLPSRPISIYHVDFLKLRINWSIHVISQSSNGQHQPCQSFSPDWRPLAHLPPTS